MGADGPNCGGKKGGIRMKKILIVNPFGIGDVLFSTPIIRALRRNLPGAFFGYLCNRRAYPVLETNSDINKIFIFEKDEFRVLWKKSKIKFFKEFFALLNSIRKARFDTVIDLSLSDRYSFFLSSSG